jgi:hypothetical protein
MRNKGFHVLLFSVLCGAPAWADPLPPYRGTCSVEQQRKEGETCEECKRPTSKTDQCRSKLEKQGYERRCDEPMRRAQTREVWCRKDKPDGVLKPKL